MSHETSGCLENSGSLYRGDWGTKISSSGSWVKLKLAKRSKSGLAKGMIGWVAKRYASECTPTQLD